MKVKKDKWNEPFKKIEGREGTISALRVNIVSTIIMQLILLLTILWSQKIIFGVGAVFVSVCDNIFIINKLNNFLKSK